LIDHETIAVVDFGTNTVKLTVAQRTPAGIRETFSDAVSIRIGSAIDPDSARIAEEAIDRAVGVLVAFEQASREHGATRFTGVATEAFRAAVNGVDLLRRIELQTSWQLRIISGDEEARLTFNGLRDKLPATGTGVIIDIGGGSSEVILARDQALIDAESLRIGSGGLTDSYLFHDPPADAELARARTAADAVIGKTRIVWQDPVDVLLVAGGAGQFLDELALTMWQEPLSLSSLPLVEQVLAKESSWEITQRITISQQRARVLPGGLQIALGAIDRFEPRHVRAVPSGIRLGVLQDVRNGIW
jgi:exopolyphosphatase/guanosine-5'-triphosphate,3'-diphosphate pyrophosphatase